MSPRVKVCCIKSVEEAKAAVACGAAAVGLVSAMPSGPGVISEPLIAEVAASVPPPIATFLLTSETEPNKIIDQQIRCGTNTIQLCDHLPPSVHEELRGRLPGIKLVQVVHVEDSTSIEYAIEAAGNVDALLLDSGKLSATVKELGGTGRAHDWSLSKQIRERVRIPMFLAGGLTTENIGEAINTVNPFGLDLCSSVRADDKLDSAKLHAFFDAVCQANQ